MSKRWYCEYHTNVGRKRVYGQINREHNKEQRYKLILLLKQSIEQNLFLPKGAIKPVEFNSSGSSTFELFTRALEKKKYLKANSIHALEMASSKFLKYLLETSKRDIPAHLINKTDIENYKDWMLQNNLSNRSINNYIKALRTMYNFSIEQFPDLLTENPAKKVKLFPSISTSHEIYTEAQLTAITNYFEQKKQYNMLLFCRFIVYTFLRPSEIRKIKIRHIDLIAKTVTIPAFNNKTNEKKTKVMHRNIVELLQLMELHKYPENYYVFGDNDLPNHECISKNYPLRRFSILRKKLKLRNEQTMYSLRHTYVCMMLRNGVSAVECMKHTGHHTLAAFEKYARSIYTEPADLTIFDKLPVIF